MAHFFNTHVFLLVGVGVSPVVAQSTVSPEEMLVLLQARDAQIDNARIRYIETYEVLIPDEMLSNLAPGQLEDVLVHDKKVKHRYKKQLTVRRFETTFTSEAFDQEVLDNPEGWRISPFERRSNRKGTIWSLAEAPGGGKDLTIRPGGPADDVLLDSRAHTELCLGIGLGKWMKEITSVELTPGGYHVVGTITPYVAPESSCEALLDENLIPRSVTIVTENEKDTVTTTVQTEGEKIYPRIAFPETGRFQRVVLAKDTSPPKSRTLSDFNIVIEGVDWDLSDVDYEEFTGIDIEPGMQVVDHVSGIRFTAGQSENDIIRQDVVNILDEVGASAALSVPANTPGGQEAPEANREKSNRAFVSLRAVVAGVVLAACMGIVYTIRRMQAFERR